MTIPRTLVIASLIAFLAALSPASVLAEHRAKTKRAIVAATLAHMSPGWNPRTIHFHDLNGDGIEDVVAEFANEKFGTTAEQSMDQSPSARVRIYFADEEGNLKIQTQSSGAICYWCGGAKGGSQTGIIKLANGEMTIQASDGSRNYYEETTTWRYKDDDFYLTKVEYVDTDTIAPVGCVRSMTTNTNVASMKVVQDVATVVRIAEDREVISKSKRTTCRAPAALSAFRFQNYELLHLPLKTCTPIPECTQ